VDADAEQIAFWIQDHPDQGPWDVPVPSRATINRILARRGMVIASPQRRPKKSRHRFEAAQPNSLWQLDGFDYRLKDGTAVTILQILDDCSRMDLALRAVVSENAVDAWAAVLWAIERHGLPARFLTDNGTAFSGRPAGLGEQPGGEPARPQRRADHQLNRPPADLRQGRTGPPDLPEMATGPTPPSESLTDLQLLLDGYRNRYNHRRRKTPGRAHPRPTL